MATTDRYKQFAAECEKREAPKGPLELNRSAADYWLPLCEPDLLPLC